jgi:hypothetical protein
MRPVGREEEEELWMIEDQNALELPQTTGKNVSGVSKCMIV